MRRRQPRQRRNCPAPGWIDVRDLRCGGGSHLGLPRRLLGEYRNWKGSSVVDANCGADSGSHGEVCDAAQCRFLGHDNPGTRRRGDVSRMAHLVWNTGSHLAANEVLRSMDAAYHTSRYRCRLSLSDNSHGIGCTGKLPATTKFLQRATLAGAAYPALPDPVCPAMPGTDPRDRAWRRRRQP